MDPQIHDELVVHAVVVGAKKLGLVGKAEGGPGHVHRNGGSGHGHQIALGIGHRKLGRKAAFPENAVVVIAVPGDGFRGRRGGAARSGETPAGGAGFVLEIQGPAFNAVPGGEDHAEPQGLSGGAAFGGRRALARGEEGPGDTGVHGNGVQGYAGAVPRLVGGAEDKAVGAVGDGVSRLVRAVPGYSGSRSGPGPALYLIAPGIGNGRDPGVAALGDNPQGQGVFPAVSVGGEKGVRSFHRRHGSLGVHGKGPGLGCGLIPRGVTRLNTGGVVSVRNDAARGVPSVPGD